MTKGGGGARLLTFSVSCGRYSVSAFDHSVSPIDNAHIRLPYGALGNRLNECGSMRSFSYVAIMRPLARQKKPLFADALEIQTSVGPQKKRKKYSKMKGKKLDESLDFVQNISFHRPRIEYFASFFRKGKLFSVGIRL